MSKKIEYKELLGLSGAISAPTTRLGLARVIKQARAERRLVKRIAIGYAVEKATGEIREFAKRSVRVWPCIG